MALRSGSCRHHSALWTRGLVGGASWNLNVVKIFLASFLPASISYAGLPSHQEGLQPLDPDLIDNPEVTVQCFLYPIEQPLGSPRWGDLS